MDPWQQAVGRGDIRRGRECLSRLDRTACVFLGNGHVGACFDFLGGMANDMEPDPPGMLGMTCLISPWHISGGPFGMDYVVPVGRLLHRFGTLEATRAGAARLLDYEQHLCLAEGVLRTRFAWEESDGTRAVAIEQFFPLTWAGEGVRASFAHRIVLIQGPPLALHVRFRPVRETGMHYGGVFRASAPSSAVEGGMLWTIETDRVTTGVALLSDVGPDNRIDDGFSARLAPGEPLRLSLAVASSVHESDPSVAAHAGAVRVLSTPWDDTVEAHRSAWADEWRQGWIDPGDPPFEPAVHAVRTLYCLTAGVSPVPGAPPPLVCGLARVAWPSYFPQDFAFLYANAVLFGRRQRARAMAEWWPAHLDDARRYAHRLIGLDTAYYPWTAPIVTWDDSFHAAGPPNRCYYEHHNQAYVARMLDLYTSHLDAGFAPAAYPVVRDLAETYRAMLRRRSGDPVWETRFTPATSQDEVAPSDCANFFDLLVSAEYVLALAVRWSRTLGIDENLRSRWQRILTDGLAYASCARGAVYGAYEGDDRAAGVQKHPVQLNPIALLPMVRRASDPRVVESWRRRYEILDGVHENRGIAWTVGELALASARMRDAEALASDLRLAQRCGLYDEECVQWRESTGSAKTHFLTTPGLVCNAVAESLVQSWRGFVEIDPCRRSGDLWPRLRFAGLRLPDGWSADRTGDESTVELTRDGPAPLAVRVPPQPARANPGPDAQIARGTDPVGIWHSSSRIVLRQLP